MLIAELSPQQGKGPAEGREDDGACIRSTNSCLQIIILPKLFIRHM